MSSASVHFKLTPTEYNLLMEAVDALEKTTTEMADNMRDELMNVSVAERVAHGYDNQLDEVGLKLDRIAALRSRLS